MPEREVPNIRVFTAGDIEKILEIEKGAFPKSNYPKAVLLHYANHDAFIFAVLETRQDIVGYIIFERGGHIISTAVLPGHRRKGFGKMLFTYAHRQTHNNLWLEVRSKNRGAISFYIKMGMKIVGKTQNYYGDDDALIMRAPMIT